MDQCVCFGGKAPSGLNDTWHSHYYPEKQTYGSGAQQAYLHTHTRTLTVSVRELVVELVCPLRQTLKDMFMTSCLVSPGFITKDLSFSVSIQPSICSDFISHSLPLSLLNMCVKTHTKTRSRGALVSI